MKKLKEFDTFAGIGSQHKALEYLKSKYGYGYEVVARSEWDIEAIIAYASVHYPKFAASRSEYAEREQMNKNFKNWLDSDLVSKEFKDEMITLSKKK